MVLIHESTSSFLLSTSFAVSSFRLLFFFGPNQGKRAFIYSFICTLTSHDGMIETITNPLHLQRPICTYDVDLRFIFLFPSSFLDVADDLLQLSLSSPSLDTYFVLSPSILLFIPAHPFCLLTTSYSHVPSYHPTYLPSPTMPRPFRVPFDPIYLYNVK